VAPGQVIGLIVAAYHLHRTGRPDLMVVLKAATMHDAEARIPVRAMAPACLQAAACSTARLSSVVSVTDDSGEWRRNTGFGPKIFVDWPSGTTSTGCARPPLTLAERSSRMTQEAFAGSDRKGANSALRSSEPRPIASAWFRSKRRPLRRSRILRLCQVSGSQVLTARTRPRRFHSVRS